MISPLNGPWLPKLSGVVYQHVKTVLLCGVAAVLAAAPFLGAQSIKWFVPLIAIFPEKQQTTLLPVSSILFGLVTLMILFYAGESIKRRSRRRAFLSVCAITVASVIALLALFVAKVVEAPGFPDPFVIGWTRHPGICPGATDSECIDALVGNVDAGWQGSVQVKLLLFLSYLVTIEGFVTAAGLLVLRPSRRRRPTSRPKPQQRRVQHRPPSLAPKTPTRRVRLRGDRRVQ